MNASIPPKIDRRLAIKWMLAVSAGAVMARTRVLGAPGHSGPPGVPMPEPAHGYGTDPNMVKPSKPGDYWPLTFTEAQRRQAAVLSDLVIPTEGAHPSASAVGVVDFLDEWVSAPYRDNVRDRKIVLDGMAWLDEESVRRTGRSFAESSDADRASLAEEMSRSAGPEPEPGTSQAFFRLFRDLVGSGYFTTPVGMKDLGYVGNVPLATFDGPPAELVAKLGLVDEVKW